MVRITQSTTKTHATLEVSGSLAYREIPDARSALLSFLNARENGLPIRLDLNGIDQVDLAGAQLMYALERSILDAGLLLELVDGAGLERVRALWAFAGLRPLGAKRGV